MKKLESQLSVRQTGGTQFRPQPFSQSHCTQAGAHDQYRVLQFESLLWKECHASNCMYEGSLEAARCSLIILGRAGSLPISSTRNNRLGCRSN